MVTTIRVPAAGQQPRQSSTWYAQQAAMAYDALSVYGEDPRSRSYCTASRSAFLGEHVTTRLGDFPATPEPWQQRPEVMADTIAFALNAVSAETEVTFYAWPHTNARVVLPNGWQVSVNYGPQAYSSVRPDFDDPLRAYERLFADRRGPGWADETTAAEVAIFQPDGDWFEPHAARQRTWGYVQSADLLRVIDAVATMPSGGEGRPLDGIVSEDCPCPNCVLVGRFSQAGRGGG